MNRNDYSTADDSRYADQDSRYADTGYPQEYTRYARALARSARDLRVAVDEGASVSGGARRI